MLMTESDDERDSSDLSDHDLIAYIGELEGALAEARGELSRRDAEAYRSEQWAAANGYLPSW